MGVFHPEPLCTKYYTVLSQNLSQPLNYEIDCWNVYIFPLHLMALSKGVPNLMLAGENR